MVCGLMHPQRPSLIHPAMPAAEIIGTMMYIEIPVKINRNYFAHPVLCQQFFYLHGMNAMAIIECDSYLLTAFLFRIQYSFTFHFISRHGFFGNDIDTHVQCFYNKFIMGSIYGCYNNII